MRIKSFLGENVHGYLTFDIKLNDDLTFLNGINGSGKTTIVNSIVSLITPDLEWLTLTEYSKIAVIIDLDGQDISIESERTEKRLLLRCSKVSKPLAIPLPILEEIEPSVLRRIQTASGRFAVRRGRILLRGMKDHEVITAIESLPTPMFLGLERTTRRSSFFDSEPEFEEPDEYPRNVFRGSLDESLKEAGAIAKDAYQDLRRQQEVLTSELRKRLILSAFRHQEGGQDFPMRFPGRQAVSDIDRHFKDVKNVLLQLGIEEVEVSKSVAPFFGDLKDTIQALPSGKSINQLLSRRGKLTDPIVRWFQMRPQEERINQIISLIDRYNEEVRNLLEVVDRYKELANRFLNDSGKNITFAPDERLVVTLPNGDVAPLISLSSGERQIVVILTHLAFNKKAHEANVLIVDEPEISLHVKWQENFVDALRDANPSTQIILATHSPSIILDRVDRCIDL